MRSLELTQYTPDLSKLSKSLPGARESCIVPDLGRKAKTFKTKEIERIKTNSKVNLILSLIAMTMVFVENELYYQNNYEESSLCMMLRSGITILSLTQGCLIISYYKYKLELRKHADIIHYSTSLRQDTKFRSFMIELLLNSCFLPPYVNLKFKINQLGFHNTITLDDIYLVVVLCRCYHFTRFLHYRSSYNTERGHFFCSILNTSFSVQFSLKAYIKEHSILYSFAASACLLIVSGFLLRVVDRSISESVFGDVWTGMWVIGVTQTTVGYGDYTPYSHVGRAICMVSCFFGAFLCSYLVLVTENMCELERKEQELFLQILSDSNLKNKLNMMSIVTIQRWWRLILSRKLKISRLREVREFFRYLYEFARAKKIAMINKNFGIQIEVDQAKSLIDKKVWKAKKEFEKMEELRLQALKMCRYQENILLAMKRLKVEKLEGYSGRVLSNSANKIKIKMKKERDHARRKLLKSFFR